MPKKWLGILAALVVIVIGLILVTGGGSSSHSSEWHAAETAQLESELTESTLQPSSSELACIVKATKSAFSPSVVSEPQGSPDEAKFEQLVAKCNTTLNGLPACESNVNSPECIQEAAARGLESSESELGLGSEGEEYPEEEYGYSEEEAEGMHEGLEEMDEELQEEYENEEIQP